MIPLIRHTLTPWRRMSLGLLILGPGVMVLLTQVVLLLLPQSPPAREDAALLQRMDLVVACVVGTILGCLRASWFHPALSKSYRQWLLTTPWSAAKPLPLGPARFTLFDAIVGAVLYAFVRFHGNGDGLVLLAFVLGAFLFVTARSLFLTARPEAWAVPWAFVGCFALYPRWDCIAGVLAITYAVAALGVAKSWPAFPWGLDDVKDRDTARGWPLTFLSPRVRLTPPAERLRRSIGGAAFLGWCVFCGILQWNRSHAEGVHRQDLCATLALTTGASAFIRWAAYRLQARPPISLRGRLVTGRWLIPGFDRHALGPLAVLASGFSLTALAWNLELPMAPAAGVSVFAIVSVALLMPPSLAQWRLTGQFNAAAFTAEQRSANRQAA